MKRIKKFNEDPPKRLHRGRFEPVKMVDPCLLNRARRQGLVLKETEIRVLGLRESDLKRLKDININTLEQISTCDEETIRTLPHFGLIKVNRIKEDLKSYLINVLDEQKPETNQQPSIPETETIKLGEPEKQANSCFPVVNSDSGLKSFSNNLDDLEKRIGLIELRLARAKIKYQKIAKQLDTGRH
jgi:hypothetical protein